MGNRNTKNMFDADNIDIKLTSSQYLDRLVTGYINNNRYNMHIPKEIIEIFYLYIGDAFNLQLDPSSSETYRIVVVGMTTCGKSALIIHSIVDQWNYEYEPTIDPIYKRLFEIDRKPAYLEVLEPSDLEEFRSIKALQYHYYKSADGFLFVYSISSKLSFEYLNTLKDDIITARKFYFKTSNLPIVIAANKCDLEELRQVTKNEGKELANLWNCPFYETSARNKINHRQCFEQVVREIRKRRQIDYDTKKISEKRCI
eukprot:105533_1